MRLLVQILPLSTSDLPSTSHGTPRSVALGSCKMTLVVDSHSTLRDVCPMIEDRYRRDYLHEDDWGLFVIEKLQDGFGGDLDLSYSVADVFEGITDPRHWEIRVFRQSPHGASHMLPPTTGLTPTPSQQKRRASSSLMEPSPKRILSDGAFYAPHRHGEASWFNRHTPSHSQASPVVTAENALGGMDPPSSLPPASQAEIAARINPTHPQQPIQSVEQPSTQTGGAGHNTNGLGRTSPLSLADADAEAAHMPSSQVPASLDEVVLSTQDAVTGEGVKLPSAKSGRDEEPVVVHKEHDSGRNLQPPQEPTKPTKVGDAAVEAKAAAKTKKATEPTKPTKEPPQAVHEGSANTSSAEESDSGSDGEDEGESEEESDAESDTDAGVELKPKPAGSEVVIVPLKEGGAKDADSTSADEDEYETGRETSNAGGDTSHAASDDEESDEMVEGQGVAVPVAKAGEELTQAANAKENVTKPESSSASEEEDEDGESSDDEAGAESSSDTDADANADSDEEEDATPAKPPAPRRVTGSSQARPPPQAKTTPSSRPKPTIPPSSQPTTAPTPSRTNSYPTLSELRAKSFQLNEEAQQRFASTSIPVPQADESSGSDSDDEDEDEDEDDSSDAGGSDSDEESSKSAAKAMPGKGVEKKKNRFKSLASLARR